MDGIQQIRQQFNISLYLYCSDACVLLYLLYSIKNPPMKVESGTPSLHFLISEGPKLPPTRRQLLQVFCIFSILPVGKIEKFKSATWEAFSEVVDEPELKHKITSLLILQDHSNLLRNIQDKKTPTLVADL